MVEVERVPSIVEEPPATCRCLAVSLTPMNLGGGKTQNASDDDIEICKVCSLQTSRPEPNLVLDLKFDLPLPFNYRCARDGLKAQRRPGVPEPDLTGLSDLMISGSGQITGKGLKWIFAHLGMSPDKVIVVDLRQEGHGFASDRPLTYHAMFNWANVGKTHEWIIADEARRLAMFEKQECTRFYEEVKSPANPDGVIVPHRTIPVIHNCVGLTEKALVESQGAHYQRFTITDHARPADDMVDRFTDMVRHLPPRRNLHMHCRAGRGRTTMFMCMVDMLHNAPRVAFRDIVSRQGLLPKDEYDLLKIPQTWKGEPMADRAAFLVSYYEYSKAHPLGSPEPPTWSEWLEEHEDA